MVKVGLFRGNLVKNYENGVEGWEELRQYWYSVIQEMESKDIIFNVYQ